jgi:hypothetical protein
MIGVEKVKKILLAAAFFLLLPLPAFASDVFVPSAVSADAAVSDAETVLSAVAKTERLTTPSEFEGAFGASHGELDLGAGVYRNVDWQIPLASADVPLGLHVGFNYDRKSEWSMSLGFDNSDAGREYFAALCRGFELLTGHVSNIVRFETMRSKTSVNAYYPLNTKKMLAVTSTDDDFTKIFLLPTPVPTAEQSTAAPVGVFDLDHSFDKY